MRTELLLEHFALLRTPQDVPQLEAAILDLAVRGELVPQDPDDEPASVLFERIKAEKQRLVRDGTIRRSKRLPSIKDDDTPFELPRNWIWTRLGNIGDWGAGATPSRRNSAYWDSGTIPWLKTGELNDGYINQTEEFVTELALQETSLRLNKPGDVLIAMYGATIGKLGILETEITTNQACCACTPFSQVYNRYLFYYLLSMRRALRAKGAGGAQPNISKTKIVHTLFPLPPLAEQKRIVAKVDELLTQTRALAAQLQAADDALLPTAQAAFQALVEAPPRSPRRPGEQLPLWETGASAQRQAWERVASAFDALTADPRTIEALKQTVLGLAVQGKLVPQDPDDEPASVLLERIEAEKTRLVNAGKVRKRKALPCLEAGEVPYRLPESWSWIKLDEIAEIASGVTKGRDLSKSKTVTLPYLRVANVQRGYLDLSKIKEIEIKEAEQDKYLLRNGDLLLTEGGDADKLGRSAIWGNQIPNCIHQNHIFRARMYLTESSAEWIMLCTNSQYGRRYFLGSAKQTTNLASINMTQLRNFPVPLPPFPEQRRIVAQVEALLGLCDALAAQVVAAEEVRAQLLQAILNGGRTTT
jgi:type I restriction enzyme S subunit